jgi:pimeloyl-ACP methyl ester carboxylesterase
MNASAPRIDGDTPPIGFRRYHHDISQNFECNRWVESIGPAAIDEVAELARGRNTYPEWIDGFLRLAEIARAADRALAAAYYDRAAGFFMTADDPRRPAARARFVDGMRAIYGLTPDEVPFGSSTLPAYDLRPAHQNGGPILLFGGFDSYIEEFFPMVAGMVDAGRRIIMFDGPGQGGALEDYGLRMIPEWERPVAAVLDHYHLDDVTAVGISLGGGLVIRAAAFEPRITRVVAFDVLDSFFEVVARQIGPGAGPALRSALSLRMRRVVNALAARAAAFRPVSEWGLQQGMHVTGGATPYDFLHSTLAFNTGKISRRVTGDVLLLAGADDHFVPLRQLARQAANLTRARSVTTRTFTAAEDACNHCQVGNIGLAARVMIAWLDQTESANQAERSNSDQRRSHGASSPIFS